MGKGRAFSPALSLAVAIWIGALAVAATVTGCGGGDEGGRTYSVEASTTVTAVSISKPRYVPKINAICKKAWGEIFDGWAYVRRGQDPELSARQRFVEGVRHALIPGITVLIFDRIHVLGAPPGEEPQLEEIIGAMQSASERGEKKLAPVGTIAQVVELYSAYNRLARDYGLDQCLVDERRLQPIDT